MRQWIAALAVFLVSCGVAVAATELPTAAEQATIRSVIEQQIDAFRRDDGAQAFGYASPNIQAVFGSAENFMAMVRSAYPSVYRPRHVEFRALELRGGLLIQPVLMIGPDGVPVLALYTMARQPDGEWRIDGCVLAELADKAV